MKENYDFSKGEKGKFHFSEDEIEFPIYLNNENKDFYINLAKENRVDLSKLINNLLSKDRDLFNTVFIEKT